MVENNILIQLIRAVANKSYCFFSAKIPCNSHTTALPSNSTKEKGETFMEHQELKENLEEQIRDAMNILQLLEVELSANEDDEHIIRTVSIVEKILKSSLELLKHIN